MIRYRSSDLPPGGLGAFTPIPANTPTPSSQGLVRIYGAPGTVAQPAPAPQRNYLPPLSARPGRDAAQGSEVSPDATKFSVYLTYADNMGPAADAGLGMFRRRLAELPVPAVDPRRIPTVAQAPPPRLGGRYQVGWPRAFQRFPLQPGAQ